MSKLIVELPEELHLQLKQKSALSNKTLKEIITSLLENYLSKTKKENIKETGFCGVWNDKRNAEEIIKEIKANRKWFKK